MACAAAASSVSFSFVAIDCSCCAIRFVAMRCRSNRWHRDKNRDRQFFRLGRGQTENDVFGRLFQRLEQRVGRFLGQHVHLVDDVNFEAPLRRRVTDVVAQLPDVIDPAVARCVQLNDIETVSAGDLPAIVAYCHTASLSAHGCN